MARPPCFTGTVRCRRWSELALSNFLADLLIPVRHKCFISYHHADEEMVAHFVDTFDHQHDVFIRRRLGEEPGDLINSSNTEYVMRQIRERYLRDTTVTIVMLGRC